MKKVIIALLAAGGLFTSLVASAFTVDQTTATGTSFSVSFNLANGSNDGNGNTNNTGYDLTATVVFTFQGFDSSGNLLMDLNVQNTTNALCSGSEACGIQKFAFGTEPDATSATLYQDGTTGGPAADATDSDKFLSASTSVSPELSNATLFELDVESLTGTGGPSTLNEGQNDVFRLAVAITGVDGTGTFSVDFTPFCVKWQTDPDSFEDCGSEPPQEVPEPATLGLLGAGLLGLGLMRRRRTA